jgi:hypothetical protein
MKTATQTIRKIDRLSDTIFWSLLVGIVALSGLYMFNVQKAIRNVVERNNIQADIVALSSKLSESEFQYINSVGDITLESAHKLGFQSAVEKTFVTRERISQTVAIR